MKLRRIELTNLRRFGGKTAVLDGLPDGIAVVSEPNEFGKSTFFDAIQALFFEPHTSAGKIAKSLKPHSGGNPAVALEVEWKGQAYRIEKRWLGSKMARVSELASQRLIAQGDEAEAWISQLLTGGEGGPAGLLWVRQGAFTVDPESAGAASKRLGEELRATRRGLVAAVSGELDALTGGRRMEHVERRVEALLEELVTSRGKAKAGTEWYRLQQQIDALGLRRKDVAGKVARLRETLTARRRDEAALSALMQPQDRAARTARVQEAKIALEEALSQAQTLDRLKGECRLLEIRAKEARREEAAALRLSASLSAARHEEEALSARIAKAELRAEGLRQSHEGAKAILAQAEAAAEALDLRLNKAFASEAARARAALQSQKREALAAAEAQQALLLAAKAHLAAARATAADEKRLTALHENLLRLKTEAESSAVQLRFSGALNQIQMDGAALSQAQVAVPARALFTLGALGTLEVIAPAAARADLPALEREFAKSLSDLNFASLEALRHALKEAEGHQAQARAAEAMLGVLAPKGLAALALEVAELAALPSQSAESEDPAQLEPEVRAAKGAAQSARAAAERARADWEEESAALRSLRQSHALALETFTALSAERGPEDAFSQKVAQLSTQALQLEGEFTQKSQEHSALAALVPDLALAQSRFARAKEAEAQAEDEIAQLTLAIHGYSTLIGREADEGVEEELGQIEGEIAALELRSQAYAREAKVLSRLEAAVKEARSSAREAYLTPLFQELKPLLHVMAPDGAQIELDEETLLPIAIVRGGQREEVDVLSGGTREQLAVLTRLAFARILARSGEDVPVILDDALVHSDDERIIRMFDMLHDLARDRQILVFTCRQRAFTELGGQRMRVALSEA